jgi:hypothetical protein
MKESKIPRHWKRIWRDSRIPAGAARLLMEMKDAATLDVLRVKLHVFAKRVKMPLRSVERYIEILSKLRAIVIRNNERRGNQCESTYFIDDVRFAKFLSESARPKRKQKTLRQFGGPVPSVLSKLPATDLDPLPDNVIPMNGKEGPGTRCRLS